MAGPQELDLTWISKEIQSKVEPRILLKTNASTYFAKLRVASADSRRNRLFFSYWAID